MKILEQCGCKESLPPVKMQYLVNFHFKELETALCDELLKLKWNVKSVKPGDQCLSIEVKNYTDDKVLEDVILLLSDEVNKVNYCQSMQASTHPELLLKEYIDRGILAIYVDGEKVFFVRIVEDPKKVTEMLRKTPTSTDCSSNAAYSRDIQFEHPFKCQLLIHLQLLPSLKQKYPSVNVAINEERSIMSFCGDNHADVHAAVEDVHLLTKDFAVEDITFTSERRTPTLPITKQKLGVSKEFVNFYSKLKSDVWKELVDFYKVHVEIDQNDEVFVVGSEKQKVQEAVSQLLKEIGKLPKEKWSCEVFGPRDIQAKLQSDIIPSLENQFQCSVSIESNTSPVYQQQLGQWVNWDKGLHLILVHGHTSEMAADVLVCPVNKSLNLSRLGSSMMEKGKYKLIFL